MWIGLRSGLDAGGGCGEGGLVRGLLRLGWTPCGARLIGHQRGHCWRTDGAPLAMPHKLKGGFHTPLTGHELAAGLESDPPPSLSLSPSEGGVLPAIWPSVGWGVWGLA